MTKQKTSTQFAICINTDDPDLLTPRMIYEILPDESAAKSDFVRIIDNEGEDYLYPVDYFVPVDLPQATRQALLRVSHPNLQPARVRPRRRTTSQSRRQKEVTV
jgi:hypothetical protein